MKVNIFREIAWFGGNTWQPIYFDELVFKTLNTLRAGKSVPAHYHKHFAEHWTVIQGVATFVIDGKRIQKGPGDQMTSPANEVHSIVNHGDKDVILDLEIRPCVDMHKMMAILAGLQDDNEKGWAMKYFYVEKRAGLKEFSTPAEMPIRIVSALLGPPVMLAGRLIGWDKYIHRYLPA